MLSQHWAADSMGDGEWATPGEERKGQEQGKDTQLGDEENNNLSVGQNLHNLPYEMSDRG